MFAESSISIGSFLSGAETETDEEFSGGEVKFRVKVDQPNVFREEGIISTIADFYPNLYSNYMVNNIIVDEAGTSVEEINTILFEDLSPSIGI